MTHTINTILSRVSRGDAKAFEALYQTMASPLFAYLRRMGLSTHDADDIVQTAFSRIWHYRQSFKGEKGQAWVYQITRNCLRDLQNGVAPNSSIQLLEHGDFGPEQLLQSEQTKQRLNRALDSLPPLTREAVVLSRFSTLSIEEIALLLSLTENNIKVRIHRGLEKLKEALHDE